MCWQLFDKNNKKLKQVSAKILLFVCFTKFDSGNIHSFFLRFGNDVFFHLFLLR